MHFLFLYLTEYAGVDFPIRRISLNTMVRRILAQVAQLMHVISDYLQKGFSFAKEKAKCVIRSIRQHSLFGVWRVSCEKGKKHLPNFRSLQLKY